MRRGYQTQVIILMKLILVCVSAPGQSSTPPQCRLLLAACQTKFGYWCEDFATCMKDPGSLPMTESTPTENIDMTTRLLQVVSEEPEESGFGAHERAPSSRWPAATMPNGERQRVRRLILSAINEISSRSCVRFRTCMSSDEHCVVFNVTYQREYVEHRLQTIGLGLPCWWFVSEEHELILRHRIVHEIMHALGFWHEHSRPDRDRWIRINETNIRPERLLNFRKAGVIDVTTLGIEYDYDSLMHYPLDANAIDPLYPVMEPVKDTIAGLKNKGIVIGQENHLSQKDVLRINKVYRCPRRAGNTKRGSDCAAMSNWLPWGSCSKTCDWGARVRTRRGGTHTDDCPIAESSLCKLRSCSTRPTVRRGRPRGCVVGQWSVWGPCSVTCGTGTRQRSRRIISRAEHEGVSCQPAQLDDQETCRMACRTQAGNVTILAIQSVAPRVRRIDVEDGPKLVVTELPFSLDATFSSPRYPHGVLVASSDTIYSIGGYANDYVARRVEVLTPQGWQLESAHLVENRLDPIAAFLPKQNVLIVCGCSGNREADGSSYGLCETSCEIKSAMLLDSSAWKKRRLPSGHCFVTAAAVVLNDKLYISGGYDCGDGTVRWIMKRFLEYDYEENKWIKRANMKQKRARHAMVADRGTIIVCGGASSSPAQSKTVVMGSCERYQPRTDSWSNIAPLPTTLWIFNMFNIGGGRLLAFGGYSSSFLTSSGEPQHVTNKQMFLFNNSFWTKTLLKFDHSSALSTVQLPFRIPALDAATATGARKLT